MRPTILKPSLQAEFPTPERCYILELSNSTADEGVSVARARVEPGVTTCLHAVDATEERYLIVSGSGRVRVGDSNEADLTAGDLVLIPAGTAQQITNTGHTDLVFYCICTPRFRQSNYRALE